MTALKTFNTSVVVVTGASMGIGFETAALFARAKAKVALLARNAGNLANAEKRLLEVGATVKAYVTDVTDENAVQTTFLQIEKELGFVDVLINNAGVGFATDLSACSMEDYRRIMETNLTGVFLCTRAVLPSMKKRKLGHIINISSITGKVSNPNAPLYCSSKHAVNGYTEGLQLQVASDKIRVSMVSPTASDTAYWNGRKVDRSKFLKPEEVAAAVYFVASQPDGVLIKDIDIMALR